MGQPPSLLFGRDSKAARGMGKLSNAERERLQVSSDVCWSVQARGELTRSGYPTQLVRQYIYYF